MRKYLLMIIVILGLSGCSKTIDTNTLAFEKQGDDYHLSEEVSSAKLDQLQLDLDNLGIVLSASTPVASLSTSTANILDELGINIVATVSSDSLNTNLQAKIDDGTVINLGSALEPNLEQLIKADADVVFVGSNMPHQGNYETIENLVVLPQEQYYDIYYTIDTLIENFELGSQAQNVFNEMVEMDQEAKKIANTKEFEGEAVALKYSYGNVTIAPDNTYIGSLLTELNIPNLYGDYSDVNLPMSKEQLLLDNPDYIILYGKGDEMIEQMESLKTNDNLQNLQAYQNDHIIIIESQSLNADIDSAQTLLNLSQDIYGS